MSFNDSMFEIPGYTTRSAQKVLDHLNRPVNMLRLRAEVVHNETREALLFGDMWDLTPRHHFQYTVGLQPQPMEESLNWTPHFSLDFTLTDFQTLHTLLMKIKQEHLQLLAGKIQDEGETEYTSESDRFCFQALYRRSKSLHWGDDAPKGHRLVPICNSIDVYLKTAAGRFDIGHYSLYSGMRCMTGLILEADRIHAIINGAEPEEVASIEQLPVGPRSPLERPSLVLIKSGR